MPTNNQPVQLQFKQGLEANINTDVTKNLAVEGEPHWCTDTDQLWMFDGTQNKQVVMFNDSVPSSASDTGTTGDIAHDSSYLYICTATDTWKRVAISTW